MKQNTPVIKFGLIADFRNGVNYNKENFGSGIKVINVKDFQDYSKPMYDLLDEINPKGIINEGNLLHNEDIIFVRSNGNKELIGRNLYIDNLPEKITHSAFTIRARIKDKQADPRFYAYLFRTSYIRSILSRIGNGTNISNLNQQILQNIEVPYPKLEIQRKVVSVLSAYDDLIENNLRRIKLLQEMGNRIYNEWLVQFRFPGYEDIEIVESELGLLPKGWDIKTISDFADVKSGYAFKSEMYDSNGKFGLVTIKNVKEQEFITHCDNRLDKIPAKMPDYCYLNTGDILLSLTGNVGRVCLVIGNMFLLNQRVAKIVPHRPEMKHFIFLTFSNEEFKNKMINLSNGVAQQNLSPIATSKIKIKLPPSHIMELFTSVCKPLIEETIAFRIKNQILHQTRELLLTRLVSGELNVENLDIPIIKESE